MSTSLVPVAPVFPDEGNGPYRILRLFQGRAVRTWDRMAADPAGTQAKRLATILADSRDTVFAQDHGLTGAESLADLREKVPVRRHIEMLPYLDRVEAGEVNVLARGDVRHLVETSGTTGLPKHLPVNDAWILRCNLAQRLWMLALLRDDEALAGGKALSIISPAVHSVSSGRIPIGSNTGRIFLDQPWWTRLRAAVPYAVCEIADPEVRAYTLLRHAVGKDIRSWTTANPSTILLYARKLTQHWGDLQRDAADGTLCRGPAAGLGKAERAQLSRGLRKVRLGDDPHPAETWPLRRINCWTGGAAKFFLSRLPQALGRDVPVREVGVHASEGVFAFTVDDGDPVLWLAGHVIELLDDAGGLHDPLDVEVGREYELVVTTEAGLWRYAMGDIVRVTGWLGRVPRVVFVRKAGSFLNATGEKVTEDQVLAAAHRVIPRAVGLCAATEWIDPPRVTVWIERAPDEPWKVDAVQLDAALQAENIEYASKRVTARLGPLEAVDVPAGTFARWRAERVAAGAPEAQVKDLVIVDFDVFRGVLGE